MNINCTVIKFSENHAYIAINIRSIANYRSSCKLTIDVTSTVPAQKIVVSGGPTTKVIYIYIYNYIVGEIDHEMALTMVLF